MQKEIPLIELTQNIMNLDLGQTQMHMPFGKAHGNGNNDNK